jgi:hypothetical protein
VSDEGKIAEALAAAQGNKTAAASALGMPRTTLRRRLKQMGLGIAKGPRGPQEALQEPEERDPIEVERERKDRLRTLQFEREAIQAIAGEKSLRMWLEGLVRDVAPIFPSPPPYVAPKASPGVSTETALMLWSDWHCYETVTRERTQGLNAYDAEIAARRVKRVVDESIKIKERMERGGGWRFPNAVIACNGDFVSGTIHEVERHSDAPNVVMAVYGTGMLLASAIRDVAANFEKVTVYCTSGNHGRLPDARRMQQKDPTRNWDTVIYLFAREALRGVPNVEFVIPDSYAITYEIGDKTFLQYHGHDVKSWNSIPHYGIQRYARNMNALHSRHRRSIDYLLISHFHTDSSMSTGGGKSYVNGSLIGGNEFSINGLGACDDPCQKLFFVSDPIGVNSEWSVMGEVRGESEGATYPPYPWIAEDYVRP